MTATGVHFSMWAVASPSDVRTLAGIRQRESVQQQLAHQLPRVFTGQGEVACRWRSDRGTVVFECANPRLRSSFEHATFDRSRPRVLMNASGDIAEFRVLVVDDNSDAARTLSLLLNAWGFSSRYVVDSREAVAAAEDFLPDCIISDLLMPKIDGYQLAEEFRRHNLFEKTPLIANSATPNEKRAKEAGFNYSLVKPHSTLIIADLLRELQAMNKKVEQTEEASRKSGEVVAEVRDLMREVRDDVKEIKGGLRADVDELKSDLREVKEDVKELRDELGAQRGTDATNDTGSK